VAVTRKMMVRISITKIEKKSIILLSTKCFKFQKMQAKIRLKRVIGNLLKNITLIGLTVMLPKYLEFNSVQINFISL